MSREEKDACHQWDKLGLFSLAGLVLAIVGGIVFGLFHNKGLPDGSDGLLGTIIAGLLLFARDLVAAVRAGWEEVTRGKVNEQLAAKPGDLPPAPEDARQAANQVAGAADDAARHITER
jgi:hypothetical protein